MSGLNSERSKAWTVYTGPSQTAAAAGVDNEEAAPAPWGTTSMSAISFGFVATAILISMFLIMAIFEHLFKPTPQFSTLASPQQQPALPTAKHANPQTTVPSCYACDLSVLMPGQQYPTYIAQPAPLPPCPREGTCHSHSHDPQFIF